VNYKAGVQMDFTPRQGARVVRPNEVIVTMRECEGCGALVGDTKVHDAWHEYQGRVAKDANYASSLMTPLA
jgi:hypothetical protein